MLSGNDQPDEDVDIGGNDPPTSSYPPVEIEKDAAHRNSRCSSSSTSSSDSGSSSSGLCFSEPCNSLLAILIFIFESSSSGLSDQFCLIRESTLLDIKLSILGKKPLQTIKRYIPETFFIRS